MKFNPSGGIEWTAGYISGYGAEDIAVDATGNVFVAGSKNKLRTASRIGILCLSNMMPRESDMGPYFQPEPVTMTGQTL